MICLSWYQVLSQILARNNSRDILVYQIVWDQGKVLTMDSIRIRSKLLIKTSILVTSRMMKSYLVKVQWADLRSCLISMTIQIQTKDSDLMLKTECKVPTKPLISPKDIH